MNSSTLNSLSILAKSKFKRISAPAAPFKTTGKTITLSFSTSGDNYIKPLQENFSSIRDMLRYAKSRIVSALKRETPIEYSVSGNTVLKKITAENQGTKHSVKSSLWDAYSGDIGMHGHPSHKTSSGEKIATPVSLGDAFSLNRISIKKQEIAFNEMGEYSLLKKKAGFQKMTPEKEDYYCNVYNEFMQQKAGNPPKDKVTGKILINHSIVQAIHEFWKKYADEMGFIYRTNYSFLSK